MGVGDWSSITHTGFSLLASSSSPSISSEPSVVDVGVMVKTLFYLYCFIFHLKNQMTNKMDTGWTLHALYYKSQNDVLFMFVAFSPGERSALFVCSSAWFL